MTTTALAFDAELLRRYDRPGPRYTSYPTAPQFHAGFNEAAFRDVVADSNADLIPRRLSLYVHVPFCHSPCFYCGCNRVITRDQERGGRYLDYLGREMQRTAALFDTDRELVQVHLGGGTPNFLRPRELAELMDGVAENFALSARDDRDFSIELDPRHARPEDMGLLASLGFNRVSLGVQDFDLHVQRAVNRVQGFEETAALVDACQRAGFRSVNVDLIYGLPLQTPASFARTLEQVLLMSPDRIAVYSYAHLPQLFKPQTHIREADLPSADTKLLLLQLAVEKLVAAGYVYIGMDHFAKPGDDLARAQERGGLHRNFMGYTTHAETDLLGLGVSAISHVGHSYSQNPRQLGEWESAINAGHLPLFRGMSLSADDVVRADLIQQLMCQGTVDIAQLESRYDFAFWPYFQAEQERLVPLRDDGLVGFDESRITATSRGRLLLRVIAGCFDAYLHGSSKSIPFSRAV